MGIVLPLLETCRRGMSEWTVDFTTMFTDYLAGALLLVGRWAEGVGTAVLDSSLGLAHMLDDRKLSRSTRRYDPEYHR
jgi:hypothetical protein